jgi:hypothetical protein
MPFPRGRRGRILAVSLSGAVALALWFGIVGPLVDWHSRRSDLIAERRALVRHMEAIVANVHDPQREAAAAAEAAPDRMLLTGATEAVAGAVLQGLVHDMAEKSGVSISSAEMLSPSQAGGYRKIGLRVTFYAPQWSTFMYFLQSIHQGTPRMLVDDLEIHGLSARVTGMTPVDGSLTVFGLRLSGPK